MRDELNELDRTSVGRAEKDFLSCCGSRRWARRMSAARPFSDAGELLIQSAQIWRNLAVEDWLEAFAAHPKIGAEQSGISAADASTLDELAEANRLYERKFGFIFIVCATGKSAAEMLEICRRRSGNETETEIRIAAGEQEKITEIRLKKLLESGV